MYVTRVLVADPGVLTLAGPAVVSFADLDHIRVSDAVLVVLSVAGFMGFMRASQVLQLWVP